MYPRLFSLVFALALLLSFALPVRAADPPLTPLDGYRALTWDDFTVNDTAPGLSAQTRTFLRYTLRAAVEGRGSRYTARVESLTFSGGMDRASSWRRSSVPLDAVQLLRHEQGHLAINEIRRRQLQALPLSTFPTAQGTTPRAAYDALIQRLRRWFEPQLTALEREQVRYDKETAFGTRAEPQEQWLARLGDALAASAR